MKKVLTAAAIIGLVAVPSMAFASQNNSSTPGATANVKQEDRRANQASHTSDDSTVAAMPTSNATAITEDEARATAQGQQPGKTITKVERETEHGVAVSSVKFSDGSRVDVDASSGAVVPSSANDDANEQADDNQTGVSNSGSGHQEDDSAPSNRGSNHAED